MDHEQVVFEFVLSGDYMARVALAIRGYYGDALAGELDAFCALIDSAYVYTRNVGARPRFLFRALETKRDPL